MQKKMIEIKDIIRTERGYRLDALEVTGLAPRESQALLLRASGLTVADTAKVMGCCKGNTQDRINNLFYKLKVNTIQQLIISAQQKGFLKVLTVALLILAQTTFSPSQPNRIRTARVLRTPTRYERIA
jgi:DNA-binding CsgD family transcriptional regulator